MKLKHFFHPSTPNETYLIEVHNSSHELFKDKTLQSYLERGYIEIFNDSIIHGVTLNGSTLILENDIEAPTYLIELGKKISKVYKKKEGNLRIVTSLHPNHIPLLLSEAWESKNSYSKKRWYHNILIDSLFKDEKQFRFIFKKLILESVYQVSHFPILLINSHGRLLSLLNSFKESDKDFYNEIYDFVMRTKIYDFEYLEGDKTILMNIIEQNSGTIKYGRNFIYPLENLSCKYFNTENNEQKEKWDC